MNLPIDKLEAVLDRKISQNFLDYSWFKVYGPTRVLVTGANGSIGSAFVPILKSFENVEVLATDIEGHHEYLDVTNFQDVLGVINKFEPHYIVNIAGAKHAPDGEHETYKTLSINTLGTKNIIDAMVKEQKEKGFKKAYEEENCEPLSVEDDGLEELELYVKELASNA